MSDHVVSAPHLDAPSLGQGPPPERKVHHLVADDLVVDYAQFFFDKLKEILPCPSSPTRSSDSAVSKIVTDCDRLDITSAEASTWAGLAAITLGLKTTPTCGSATDGATSGRRTIVSAVTDGAVTGTGTAGYWALVDSGTAILAAYSLSAAQAVTSGNTWTLTSFSVTFPDPA